MNDWLEKLKVGDKVFVRDNSGIRLATVQRITPTGMKLQITLSVKLTLKKSR